MRRSPLLAIIAILIAVLTLVVGLSNGAAPGRTADLVDYAVSANGLQVVVTAVVPRQCDIDRTVGEESTTAVQVTVKLSCSGGAVAGDAPLVDIPVSLKTPLGDRAVLDANGAAVSPKTP